MATTGSGRKGCRDARAAEPEGPAALPTESVDRDLRAHGHLTITLVVAERERVAPGSRAPKGVEHEALLVDGAGRVEDVAVSERGPHCALGRELDRAATTTRSGRKRHVPPSLETETELCTACGQRIPVDRYSFNLKGSARRVT